MDIISKVFKNKKADIVALIPFGFERQDERYIYKTALPSSGFDMTVTITPQGDIGTRVIDPEFDEPYILHLTDTAVGSFVGTVREEYETVLQSIADKCFVTEVFKSPVTKEVLDYAKRVYGDDPEYLWEKFPDNAVLRRKDTGKWYAAILTVSKRKLGLKSDEIAEVIDFRADPSEMPSLVDNKLYFPGYHMNKKTWCTVILDGSVPLQDIFDRIDKSYKAATK